MAKKSTRPNIPQNTLERARRQMANASTVPAAPADGSTTGAVAAAPKAHVQLSSADLSKEYAYVVTDLQSMGLLAGVFLAVLIALSFFI